MANTTENKNTTTENENAENVQAVAVPENTTEKCSGGRALGH